MTDITKGIADYLEVGFIEVEEDWGDETTVLIADTWKDAVPVRYISPEKKNAGTLQLLKFISDPTNNVVGSNLYSSLNSKRLAISAYEEASKEYNNLRLEYNAIVNELENQIDSAILAGKSQSEAQTSIIDTILGWFTSEEETPDEIDIPALIRLPPRPIQPLQPTPYDGATIDQLIPELGYGLLSAGKISLRSDKGVKKFFGVSGQGQRTQENMSFTLDDRNTRGECDSDDRVRRSYYLSVYPRIQLDDAGDIVPWDQKAERLKFTV